MKQRKVLHFSLHRQANHAPHVGELGHVFPGTAKSLEELDMFTSELGVHMKYKYKGVRLETVFPLASVALLSLAPEEDDASKYKLHT